MVHQNLHCVMVTILFKKKLLMYFAHVNDDVTHVIHNFRIVCISWLECTVCNFGGTSNVCHLVCQGKTYKARNNNVSVL